ncbi:MAG: hypothetical protein JW937_05200, partial [Candidatus Omnitrophica bacterium]|nr:hypothetical protein [Candidatus Omnitrophota bacterium]
CVYLALSKKKWTPWLTGLVLGLAVLTRPAMVLIFPGIFIWKLLDRGSSLKQRVRWIGGLLLTLSLVIAPWTIRNYQVFDAFIPMTTHAGYDLWYANRPGSWGGATFGRYTDDPIKTFEGNEVDRDQLGKELGIKAIKEDPLRYIKLCVYRLTVAFSPGQEPLMHRIVGVSTPAMNQRFQAGDKSLEIPISFWGDWMPGLFFGGVIFVAGLGGVGLAFKEDRRWLLLVYASMAYILISSLIVQEIRYRAVATVLLLPLAGYGLVHLREGLSKLFSLPLSRQTVLAWCFAGFLLFSFAYHLIGFNLPGAM